MHPRTRRDGVVLLLALLCLLALEVSAVGLHFITMQELRTSHSATRDLQLRLAARSAAAHALSAWPDSQAEALLIHERLAVDASTLAASDGITSDAVIERLDSATFLVTGAAHSPFAEIRRIGALVTTTTPSVLARSITDALRTGGAVTIAPGSQVTGTMRQESAIDDSPVVGSLDFRRLAQLARHSTASDSSLVYRPGGSAVPDGATPRVVIIDGDATMNSGTFNGVLIVRGALTLYAGAAINGSVIVIGGPVTLLNASITFDAALVLGAISNPRLLGPYRTRARMWIPLY